MNFVNKRLSRPLPTYPAISEGRGVSSMTKDVIVTLAVLTIIIAMLSKAFLFHFAMIVIFIICTPFFIIFALMDELFGVLSYVSSKITKNEPE